MEPSFHCGSLALRPGRSDSQTDQNGQQRPEAGYGETTRHEFMLGAMALRVKRCHVGRILSAATAL